MKGLRLLERGEQTAGHARVEAAALQVGDKPTLAQEMLLAEFDGSLRCDEMRQDRVLVHFPSPTCGACAGGILTATTGGGGKKNELKGCPRSPQRPQIDGGR